MATLSWEGGLMANQNTGDVLEQTRTVTAEQLVTWIQKEKVLVGEKILAESDLIVKAALDSYRENLEFLQQDILRLAKGIVLEQKKEES